MNKKLIAAAVSAAVVIPVTASAEVTVYGHIDNGIEIVDDGTNSTTDMIAGGSRFGFKASSDLGNGMTASGRYEFGTTTDEKTGAAGLNLRLGTVSLSGSFGSITLGNQWSHFYNTVGTHIDPSYNYGGAGAGILPYRTANTIKYANSVGPLSLELDLRVDDDGMGDGAGLGISVAVNDNLTLAAAFDSAGDTDKEITLVEAIAGVMAADPILGIRVPDASAAHQYFIMVGEGEAATQTQVEIGHLHTRTVTNAGVHQYTPLTGVTELNAGGTYYINPAALTTTPTDDTAVAYRLPGVLPESLSENVDKDTVVTDPMAAVEPVEAVPAETAVVPDGDLDRVALAARVNMGPMFGMLGWIKKEQDSVEHGPIEISATQLWLGSNVTDSTRVMVGYGREDYNMAAMSAKDSGANPSVITGGVYHSLGGGLSIYYEGSSRDHDDASKKDTSAHRFNIRYNF